MREELLKRIAMKGYSIGYAANLNFATYDIARLIPGMVTYLSLTIGILGLAWDFFTIKSISVFVLILGILSLYVEKFSFDIDSYTIIGKKHKNQLNKLEELYFLVKRNNDDSILECASKELEAIINEFNDDSQPKQFILFSDWFAHFKFFCQNDISWMDEEIGFKFWKHKIPQSLKGIIILFLTTLVVFASYLWVCNR